MSDANSEYPPPSPTEGTQNFAARGEAAWRQYLRDGIATPMDVVFARIDALIAERARQLLSRRNDSKD